MPAKSAPCVQSVSRRLPGFGELPIGDAFHDGEDFGVPFGGGDAGRGSAGGEAAEEEANKQETHELIFAGARGGSTRKMRPVSGSKGARGG